VEKTRGLESLILEILKGARRADMSCPFAETNAHLSLVARLDYAAALRRHFDRAQLLQIIADMRQSVPDLNRQVFATTDLHRLAEVAADLGAKLQVNSFEGREGHELRGFYVDDGKFRNRPLICVNTANHPVAVAAAFWHEVGHHLGRRIVDCRGGHALSFTTDCHDHLNSLAETIADVVMALGGYPQSAARRLFGGRQAGAIERDSNMLVTRARTHLRSISGFEFNRRCSAYENLGYLAGMIHVAKLRAALFREFEI
jgi:hypothetical protein